MVPESGIVLAVAAAFLLLGIAVSPLAWVAILNRRSRSERMHDRRFVELQGQLRALDQRMAGCESAFLALQGGSDSPRASATHPRPIRRNATAGWLRVNGDEAAPARRPVEPRLIVVPNLASAAGDREAMLSGLTQRYAAIWTLADTGCIARSDRPRDRATDRADRADPRIAAANRRNPDHDPSCQTRMTPISPWRTSNGRPVSSGPVWPYSTFSSPWV